jgi:hypothetical protein
MAPGADGLELVFIMFPRGMHPEVLELLIPTINAALCNAARPAPQRIAGRMGVQRQGQMPGAKAKRAQNALRSVSQASMLAQGGGPERPGVPS